ncbi:MAG TPA: MipA/OmpV family protein [Gammaproteobacteria bacterium]|nr:MipA/OmpV family protein [Gammaproteobacteria bacterium]
MCSQKIIIPALLALACASAQAEDQAADWHGMLLLGAGIGPQYEGSDDYEAAPLFVGNFSRGNLYMGMEDGTFRANLLDSPSYELGPLLSFGTGRDKEDIDNEAVAALGTIDNAVEAGAFAAYSWSLSEQSRMRIATEYLQDTGSVYDGWRGALSLGYSRDLSSGASLNIEASFGLVSDDYADTFYSVSQNGANASGLRRFDARGGVDKFGLSVTMGYPLSEHYGLFGVVAFQRMLGDVADSPIVADAGDPDQVMAGIGIAYLY